MKEKKVFSSPESILEDDINRLFKKEKNNELEIFFSIFSLFLYKNEHNTDMIDLYNALPFEQFIKVLQVLEGRKVQFPALKDMTDAIIFSLAYYYREVQGLTLDEIKEELYDVKKFSKLSLSLKMTHFNSWLTQKIDEQLKKLGEKR